MQAVSLVPVGMYGNCWDSPALSDIADDSGSPAEDLLEGAESPWSSPCSTPLWEPRADPLLPCEAVVPQLELPPCQPIPSTECFEFQGMQAVSLVPVGIGAESPWSSPCSTPLWEPR